MRIPSCGASDRRPAAAVRATVALAAVSLLAGGPTVVRAQDPASAPAARTSSTRIEATTYAERQAGVIGARPVSDDFLVLPFGSQARTWSPSFVTKGERVTPFAEPWHVCDRLLPRRPLHDEYLKQRTELAAKPEALIEWCRKHGLDDCAEFEAARAMDEIDDFQKPAFAPFLKTWLAIRDRRWLDRCLPLPLAGEWYVLPDTTCHHRKKPFAAYAFDLMQRRGDKAFKDKGEKLDDYYGFGQPILAQADGVVVEIDDHFPDNPPGRIGAFDGANLVIVDYGGGILADYGHCRHGSAAVKANERVQRGTKLAEVGNSGASAAPHLHFSMMDWGYLSIRGRFHGEKRSRDRWVAFDGEDLEPGTSVRNGGEVAPAERR